MPNPAYLTGSIAVPKARRYLLAVLLQRQQKVRSSRSLQQLQLTTVWRGSKSSSKRHIAGLGHWGGSSTSSRERLVGGPTAGLCFGAWLGGSRQQVAKAADHLLLQNMSRMLVLPVACSDVASAMALPKLTSSRVSSATSKQASRQQQPHPHSAACWCGCAHQACCCVMRAASTLKSCCTVA